MGNYHSKSLKNYSGLFLFLFLLILAGLGVSYYSLQKKEIKAKALKAQVLSDVKIMPLPLSHLQKKPGTKLINALPPKKLISKSVPENVPDEKIVSEDSIVEQSTEDLVSLLKKNMSNAKSLDLPALERNIQLADEIISRDPMNDSAFRSKLISMLILESKFDQSIDDYDIASIIDNIAILEITNVSTQRREASMVEFANNQILDLENKLEEILQLQDEVSNQSSGLAKDSPEYIELQIQNAKLSADENKISENLELIQNYPIDELLHPIAFDGDIVEIPFLRLMAKNNYDTVIENALVHISQFPKSLSGYYFLAKALFLEGRFEDAIRAISESNLSIDAQKAIHVRLDSTSEEDPKSYWEKLLY